MATHSADSAVTVDTGVRLTELIEQLPLSRGSVFELIKALKITTIKGPGPGGKGRVAWLSADSADRLTDAAQRVHREEIRIADLAGGIQRLPTPQTLQMPSAYSADSAAMAAAITAAMQQPPDPLRCAKALAEAAELGVPLSSIELAGVVGMAPATVSSWLDGHSPRPGFRLRRQKAGVAVWWIVERVSNADAIAVSKSNSPGTRSVGFNACLTVAAVALPYF